MTRRLTLTLSVALEATGTASLDLISECVLAELDLPVLMVGDDDTLVVPRGYLVVRHTEQEAP